MVAKKNFISLISVLLIIGAFYYGKHFLEVDKCLDNGGSFNYENDECIFKSLLNNVDLSDERASSMSKDDLWEIGVKHLGWPKEIPSEATKEDIHQILLDAKYAKVGDMGGEWEIESSPIKEILE
ncbi:MAG: hypothetical protein AAF304_09085 [Pseudomonadota bacterium]